MKAWQASASPSVPTRLEDLEDDEDDEELLDDEELGDPIAE